MPLPPEQSSSDHALRYRAPTCVALRWRGANTWYEGAAERWKRRTRFVETALRYIVATLGAEVTARAAEKAPKTWSDLRASVGGKSASLGLWAHAARDLSVAVLDLPDPILVPVAEVLARKGRRRSEEAPAFAAVLALVQRRNKDSHDDADARRLLEASESDFRAFLVALRAIGRMAPWVATRCSLQSDDTFLAQLHCLRGVEPPAPRLVPARQAVRDGIPFVVAPDGGVLYLAPFLRWGRFPLRTEPELRLYSHWSGGPWYVDPTGMSEAEPIREKETEPAAWLAPMERAWVPGVFGPEELPALLDPERGQAVPDVPGFEVGTLLGHGGTGRVYLARSLTTSETVALKVLGEALTVDHPARERLHREHVAMRRIQHPNVARVYDFLPETPAGPTLVMEYIEGTNLRNRVEQEPMRLSEALTVMEQVLGGLAAAHRQGIVHRDVTPENVLLDARGDAHLVDFGIAVVAGHERFTRTSEGLGKLSFAAPEQVGHAGDAGAPADVFSAGRLFGYLVTGSHDAADQLAALPGGLQAVIRKATCVDPAGRHPDAAALALALAEARAAGWSGAPVAPGERLSPNLQVVRVSRDLGDGLWLVEARDLAYAEARWCVVAERRPAAESALAGRHGALTSAERDAVGRPDLQQTKDGIVWCGLRGGVEDAVAAFGAATPDARRERAPTPPPAEETTTAPPAGNAAPTDTPDPRPTPRWRPPAAPPSHPVALYAVGAALSLFLPPLLLFVPVAWAYLQRNLRLRPPPPGPRPDYLLAKMLLPPDLPWPVAAATLDALALIVLAQRHAHGTAALDATRWAALRAEPLLPTWTVLELPAAALHPSHRGQFPPAALRTRMLGCVGRLHAALGGAPAGRRLRRDVTQTTAFLFQLAHAGHVEPVLLEPYLRCRDGRWCLADGRGGAAPLPWG